MNIGFTPSNNQHSVTRKSHITRDTHKVLKKMAIDFELDDDGKITPEALGECINHLVKVTSNLNDMFLSGKITLYSGKENNISIPVRARVKEYFIDGLQSQLKDIDVADIVESVSWYDEVEGSYRTFVPSVTDKNSPHNFMLVESHNQIRAFVVKTKSFNEPVEFYWSTLQK